ncbi:hypothetical protein [Candidatus Albibeggiatoa sp. nov. BB20]|uniref:hypothetical protein n=1 Tax=Candidatus Albibeggiatoa sp. nov. BB20 TaxID=3162723 RepID=UPI00336540B5
MKNIFEEISNLFYTELLTLLCDFNDHALCKYDSVHSKNLENFKSKFVFIDIEHSIPYIYEQLFSIKYQEDIINELRILLDVLKKDASNNHPVFSDIEFLQTIISTALWKYEIPIQRELEIFAREFDRIDDPAERLRIISKLKNNKLIYYSRKEK